MNKCGRLIGFINGDNVNTDGPRSFVESTKRWAEYFISDMSDSDIMTLRWLRCAELRSIIVYIIIGFGLRGCMVLIVIVIDVIVIGWGTDCRALTYFYKL